MSESTLDSLWLRILPQPLRSRLAGRRLLQTLIANAGWLVADKLVRLGVGLFVGVWVARYLGPAQFGSLNYVQAVVALIAALATMGLPDLLVRDFVRHPERARVIAATAVALRCGGALVALGIAVVVVLGERPGERELLAMAVIVASSLLPLAFDSVDQFCQARNEVRPVVVLRNLGFLGCAAAKVTAIFLHAPLIAFAAIFSAEFAVVGLALLIYGRRHGLPFTLADASGIEAARLMREAWPLLVRLLAIGVYMRVDQVLLGRLLDDRAVGIYAAAARISEIWYFIPVAVMTAVVPRLAARHAQSPAFYEHELLKVMRVIAALSLVAAIVMSLAARPIVALLYGPAYAEAAAVLAVHAWSGLFVGLGVASNAWFVNNSLLRYGLYQAVLGAAVSVALNLILIPRLGIVGAAWAVIASQFVSAVLVNACFRQTRAILRLQLRAVGFPPPKVPATMR